MNGPKRTKAEHEDDLVLISDLYLKGHSHEEITQALNQKRNYKLTRQMITYDIQKIHSRWLKTMVINADEVMHRELARVDKLESEYWQAWERSKQVSNSSESTKINDSQGANFAYKRVKSVRKRAKRDGNAEFLSGVEWCIERRCKILGLDAPKRVDVNWRKMAESEGIDPDSMLDRLTTEFIEAARQGIKPNAPPISGEDDF